MRVRTHMFFRSGMQKNKNIRLTDIARLANVSVGTVDRVIHNRGRVSEENIRRVKEIMEQVGYRPNLIARSLAVKKPCHLVALIPDFRPGDYWSAMEYGIRRAEEEGKLWSEGFRTDF